MSKGRLSLPLRCVRACYVVFLIRQDSQPEQNEETVEADAADEGHNRFCL